MTPDPLALLATLTVREREVFDLAMRGVTNEEIAARFNVSVKTVQSHLRVRPRVS